MANEGNVVTGGTTESASVTDLLLDVGDDGTLRNRTQRQDVSDGESGPLSGIDELTGVHALVGDEGLGDILEAVRVAEGDLCERSTTARVVDDLSHNAANVSMSLSIVEGTELGWRLVETGVGR